MSFQDYPELIAEVIDRTGLKGLAARAAQLTGFAERDLVRRYKLRVSDMETSATLTTDADGEVSLPSGFLQLRSITKGGVPYPPAHLDEIANNARTGYAIKAGTLLTSHASTAFAVVYYAEIPALATNDTNWLLTLDPEVYLYAVMRQAYLFAKDTEAALATDAMLGQLVEALQTQDHAERFARTPYRLAGCTP